MAWSSADIPNQQGRVCIVTGANTGLGLSNARMLAEKGATVIMACRNIDKANAAAQGIRNAMPGADVAVSALDLSSLASVHEFAARFLAEQDRLDLLINNAGVMMPPRTMTADGFELQFESNHLGHFLLTGLLLPLLNKTSDKTTGARVISLSSLAHRSGQIDFDNLNAERSYSRWTSYAQSKLACMMFGLELQRRLEKSGSKTLSLVAHPGGTNTELSRHVSLLGLFGSLFAQSPDTGSLPTMRAAVDLKVRGGEYYGPKWFHFRGEAVLEAPRKQALDKAVAAKLWAVSEKLAGIVYL
jgi:NAD(P)-dependent dehydrogenase (short-subunit alcohol dehydrogenase family)